MRFAGLARRRAVWPLFFRKIVPYVLYGANHALALTISVVAAALIGQESLAIGAYATLPGLVLLIGAVVGLVRWRDQPARLLELFYGVEIALVLVLLFYAVVVARPQPGALWILALGVVSALVVAWRLFRADEKRPISALGWIGLGSAAYAALYFGLLALLVVLPIVIMAIVNFFKLDWLVGSGTYSQPLFEVATMAWGAAFVSVMLLWLAAPAWYFAQAWRRGWQRTEPGPARRRALILTLATTLVWLGGSLVLDRLQPVEDFLPRLGQMPRGAETRRLLAERPAWVRDGLLNAYLASFRYVGNRTERSEIAFPHRKAFGDTVVAELATDTFVLLTAPWRYRGGDLRQDQTGAALLYEEFFDAPILEAEKAEIDRARRASWEHFDRGLGEQLATPVRLSRQEVQVREFDGRAEIEIFEQLENRSWANQEVIYEFSLPTHAVLTGLWLGTSEQRAQRIPALVAPRGAAEQVYLAEVRRRVDPALLAEVGPGLYRLRVFPVLARLDGAEVGPPLFLWWTFEVLDHGEAWAMPRLNRSSNVQWADAARHLNGQDKAWPAADWLPAELPRTPTPLRRQLFTGQIGAWKVEARPLPTPRPALPTTRLALVIDTSYSMNGLRAEIEKAVADLAAGGAKLTCFFATAQIPGREGSAAELAEVPMVGNLPLPELLEQFASWHGTRQFDAVAILTDHGGSGFASEKLGSAELKEPTWLIHLGERRPIGYADELLDRLERSGGGIAADAGELLDRLRWPASAEAEVVGEHLFHFARLGMPAVADETGFERMAAHQLIRHLARGVEPAALPELDQLHQIAVTQRIVSSLSSMLVLIEDRQKEALDQAAAGEDRFQRDAAENAPATDHPFGLSSVPEPEEWALAALALVLLVALCRWRS